MIKKISLAAIVALGASVVAAAPASAFNNATGTCTPSAFQDCEPDVIPTPPALLAVIGMGMASLRKKSQNQDAE
jgi:hypothetical protein